MKPPPAATDARSEAWALVDEALQVLRGAACACAAVAVPDAPLEP